MLHEECRLLPAAALPHLPYYLRLRYYSRTFASHNRYAFAAFFNFLPYHLSQVHRVPPLLPAVLLRPPLRVFSHISTFGLLLISPAAPAHPLNFCGARLVSLAGQPHSASHFPLGHLHYHTAIPWGSPPIASPQPADSTFTPAFFAPWSCSHPPPEGGGTAEALLSKASCFTPAGGCVPFLWDAHTCSLYFAFLWLHLTGTGLVSLFCRAPFCDIRPCTGQGGGGGGGWWDFALVARALCAALTEPSGFRPPPPLVFFFLCCGSFGFEAASPLHFSMLVHSCLSRSASASFCSTPLSYSYSGHACIRSHWVPRGFRLHSGVHSSWLPPRGARLQLHSRDRTHPHSDNALLTWAWVSLGCPFLDMTRCSFVQSVVGWLLRRSDRSFASCRLHASFLSVSVKYCHPCLARASACSATSGRTWLAGGTARRPWRVGSGVVGIFTAFTALGTSGTAEGYREAILLTRASI